MDKFCLDPSCFISLETLEDTFSTLKVIRQLEGDAIIYLPTNLYDTVMLDPEAKFRKLPSLVSEWIYPGNHTIITELDSEGRERYVSVMRQILSTFTIQSFSYIGESKTGDDKIGNESIHLKDLVTKFRKDVANILFDMLSLSVDLKSKIISFGNKTIELVRKIGTVVREGRSEFKIKLKDKAGIKRGLKIMQCFMALPFVHDFLKQYQIPIDVSTLAPEAVAIASFGLLIIGDG